MKKLYTFIFLFIFMFTFTACGRNTEEIMTFQNKLNKVVYKMEQLDSELNNIDVTASDAVEKTLNILSTLNDAFEELASINVTDENHMYITDLADEGAEYMAHAYELFKKAYSKQGFHAGNADLAYQYLERATKRVRVIVNMLHDKIPDDIIIN